MEVSGDAFFVLEAESGKHLFDSQSEAVDELKKQAGNGVDPESVDIWQVTTGSEWQIQQVPWNEIAFELMEE